MPTSCPACGSSLEVLRLGCPECSTVVDGRFAFGRLGRLTRAQIDFVEVFLECRGKIKDVEQRLGISYPTVVARLDEVVAAMEQPAPAPEASPEPKTETRREPRATGRSNDVLEALERGEITASEAASKLRARKGGAV
jgi:hypothetical protein